MSHGRLPSIAAQIEAQVASAATPRLIVTSSSESGRAVRYAGERTLPAGSLVALYRCLLVRADQYASWQEEGIVLPSLVESFWRNYTVDLTFDDAPGRTWHCLPIGDVDDADGTRNSWWSHGILSEPSLHTALLALNRGILVDWRREYDPSVVSDTRLQATSLRTIAPLFNEPSRGRLPNVAVQAHGAYHCGEHTYCGIAMASATTRQVGIGEELTWCYGSRFVRHYEVSDACLPTRKIGPPTRTEHATNVLSAGTTSADKVTREEFQSNCNALGVASEIDDAMIEDLFTSWDSNGNQFLERDEVEQGVLSLLSIVEGDA